MAERGGFEPPVRFNPYNGLANRRFRPLSHLSVYAVNTGVIAHSKPPKPRTNLTRNTYATRSRTKANQSRKPKQGESWPRKVQPGRAIVTVYRRRRPSRTHR